MDFTTPVGALNSKPGIQLVSSPDFFALYRHSRLSRQQVREKQNEQKKDEADFLRYKKHLIFIGTESSVVRDSSVVIATRYGLDGPGIKSRWRRDFPQLSLPTLGPIQPPIKWAPGLFPGGKSAGMWR
jgi:hypothetical protein